MCFAQTSSTASVVAERCAGSRPPPLRRPLPGSWPSTASPLDPRLQPRLRARRPDSSALPSCAESRCWHPVSARAESRRRAGRAAFSRALFDAALRPAVPAVTRVAPPSAHAHRPGLFPPPPARVQPTGYEALFADDLDLAPALVTRRAGSGRHRGGWKGPARCGMPRQRRTLRSTRPRRASRRESRRVPLYRRSMPSHRTR